jgi:hypothetical protein
LSPNLFTRVHCSKAAVLAASVSQLRITNQMNIENNSPAPEISTAPPVPSENQPPPAASEGTPPPAANLVIGGEVTDERQLALDRREAELARREMLALDAATAPKKFKRNRNWSDPVNAPEEIE